jgi:O-antigen/teichoic acid export membrane protein
MIQEDDPHGDRRAFRAGRVRLAFMTSAGSKALGTLVQFVAVPLAVRSLGPERFGFYTMLVSALVWIDLGRLGIGPGLTRELALAWNRDQRDREQALFSSAVFFLFGIAALIAGLLSCAWFAGVLDVEAIFGPAAAPYQSEILLGMAVVAVFLVMQIVSSAGEAARSAYQDEFINNFMNMLANVAALALIFWVAFSLPTIWAFSLAVFGSIALGKGANLVLLLGWSRTYLFPRWRRVDKTALRALFSTSLAFWIIQIATLLMHNLSLVQLGRMIGAEELTPFAVVFRLLQLLSTAMLMISTPLWPAITDAAVRGDAEWIKRAYRRLVVVALVFCSAAALVLALFGPALIPLWGGPDVRPDRALCTVLGLYFLIWMWNHCHSIILFGLGRLHAVAAAMLAEGVLVLVLAAVLVPRFGAVGTGLALCGAGVAVSAWILPFLVRRELFAQGDDGSALPPGNRAMAPSTKEATP